MATKEKYTEDELWSFPIGEPMDKPNGDGWYLVKIGDTGVSLRNVENDKVYELLRDGAVIKTGYVSTLGLYSRWRRIQLPDEQPDQPRTELGHVIKHGMWKTRNGSKAAVAVKFPSNPFTGDVDPYPIIGWIEGEDSRTTWSEIGEELIGDKNMHDLMEPLVDPEEWNVTVYRATNGRVGCAMGDLVGFINPESKIIARVTVREGDGIEDHS